jgi:competence protein ComFC
MIFGDHSGVLKHLIWKYKYQFIRDLSSPLAGLLVSKFKPFLSEKTPVITYVPITKRRMKWRGFNQSELLARKVAETTGLKFTTTLFRTGQSKPQVGLKRKERIKNLQGQIVGCTNKSNNKKVVIIDDVFTTGATLEECARVLREEGFREVYGMVISRD